MDVKSVSRELCFYFSLTRRFNILTMNIIITILLPGDVSALSKHLKMSNYIAKVRVVGARDRVLLLPFLSFSCTFCISSPRSLGVFQFYFVFFFHPTKDLGSSFEKVAVRTITQNRSRRKIDNSISVPRTWKTIELEHHPRRRE